MKETSFWKIAIIIILCSFISAILVLLWFFKKKNPIKKERTSIEDAIEPDYVLKRWRFFAISWSLLCLIFAGIIIYQSIKGMEKRFAGDAIFAVVPLIFFAIGMTIRRRLLKERRHATTLTTAIVISKGKRIHEGKRKFFPEYEFQVGEKIYKVTSQMGYNICYVGEGKKVELYYAPENPKLFYVPVMQKHDNRWSILLCGIGIVYPLIGLFAPQVRALFSFLYT